VYTLRRSSTGPYSDV